MISLSVGYYLYNKGPVDVSKSEGIPVDAAALYDIYIRDSAAANVRFNGKILDISGIVAGTNDQGVKAVLIGTASEGANINCALADSSAVLPSTGMKITMRGVCQGIQSDLDMGIPGDVIVNRCVIIEKK